MRKLLILILILFSISSYSQKIVVNGFKYTPPGVNDTISVKLYNGTDFPTANSRWYNWHVPEGTGSNQTSPNLPYMTGTSSGITITMSAVASDYGDNGSGWGAATTTGYPVDVFRAFWFLNGSGPETIVFNNLPSAANNYTVEILSSRNTGSNRRQAFVCNSVTVNLDAMANINNLVRFTNVPRVSTSITVTYTNTDAFTIINAIRLIKNN